VRVPWPVFPVLRSDFLQDVLDASLYWQACFDPSNAASTLHTLVFNLLPEIETVLKLQIPEHSPRISFNPDSAAAKILARQESLNR